LDKYRIYKLICSRTSGAASAVPFGPPTPTPPDAAHEGSPLLGPTARSSHQQHQHQHHHQTSYRSTTTAATAGLGDAPSTTDEDEDGPTGGRPVVAAATVAAAASSAAGTGWEALTFYDKLEILNVWTLVAMAGNVCALLFAARAVAARDDLMVDAALRVLIGLASLLLWLALIQYLEFDPRYFTLVLTIRRAIPRIGQFLIGIMPMFFGYCLLGMNLINLYYNYNKH
jgi:hypothetical protein